MVERVFGDDLRLFIELRNPNTRYGLLRTDVVIAALDDAGQVLEVQEGALPGAPCCTIYRLAPEGRYVMDALFEDAALIESLEVRRKGDWLDWSKVVDQLPSVTLVDPTLRIRDFIGAQKEISITGRVSVDRDGPFNVQVIAIVEGADSFLALKSLVECVDANEDVAFEATDLAVPPEGAKLADAWAETTTVPGITSPGQLPAVERFPLPAQL